MHTVVNHPSVSLSSAPRVPEGAGSYSKSTNDRKSAFSSGAVDSQGDPYDPVYGERAVWRAVIVQALMDAACQSKKKESLQARQESLIWLRGNSIDFATVCYHAGFEPDYVRRMVRECLQRDCSWRAAPGSGKSRKRARHGEGMKRAPNQRR